MKQTNKQADKPTVTTQCKVNTLAAQKILQSANSAKAERTAHSFDSFEDFNDSFNDFTSSNHFSSADQQHCN